ncbi:uncharacterized protein MONOS_2793 [Monocercomonoides exilis]|uniref:uncharacterized protein n=1 Tax=Monocercomonoides exilis TaxID=2049356 RepID=UPI00355996F0|nr:hypothetical protein MONOS_2793 [Monocercomonoides exilis]|eukprot:MONOS_2792.2-p1 / transcript=MONOS_2792.2 / gene=MONOS_2792 / organism=Monocercomonoides_exilis_PA203 / gene_product=unspecified product / transcript_product=unspecified product / location=Mono_scaffold00060:21594-30821(-) / protein_length=3018 / sequence_SO=supercontig / SO=protein_coding / is_pseudo=false
MAGTSLTTKLMQILQNPLFFQLREFVLRFISLTFSSKSIVQDAKASGLVSELHNHLTLPLSQAKHSVFTVLKNQKVLDLSKIPEAVVKEFEGSRGRLPSEEMGYDFTSQDKATLAELAEKLNTTSIYTPPLQAPSPKPKPETNPFLLAQSRSSTPSLPAPSDSSDSSPSHSQASPSSSSNENAPSSSHSSAFLRLQEMSRKALEQAKKDETNSKQSDETSGVKAGKGEEKESINDVMKRYREMQEKLRKDREERQKKLKEDLEKIEDSSKKEEATDGGKEDEREKKLRIYKELQEKKKKEKEEKEKMQSQKEQKNDKKEAEEDKKEKGEREEGASIRQLRNASGRRSSHLSFSETFAVEPDEEDDGKADDKEKGSEENNEEVRSDELREGENGFDGNEETPSTADDNIPPPPSTPPPPSSPPPPFSSESSTPALPPASPLLSTSLSEVIPSTPTSLASDLPQLSPLFTPPEITPLMPPSTAATSTVPSPIPPSSPKLSLSPVQSEADENKKQEETSIENKNDEKKKAKKKTEEKTIKGYLPKIITRTKEDALFTPNQSSLPIDNTKVDSHSSPPNYVLNFAQASSPPSASSAAPLLQPIAASDVSLISIKPPQHPPQPSQNESILEEKLKKSEKQLGKEKEAKEKLYYVAKAITNVFEEKEKQTSKGSKGTSELFPQQLTFDYITQQLPRLPTSATLLSQTTDLKVLSEPLLQLANKVLSLQSTIGTLADEVSSLKETIAATAALTANNETFSASASSSSPSSSLCSSDSQSPLQQQDSLQTPSLQPSLDTSIQASFSPLNSSSSQSPLDLSSSSQETTSQQDSALPSLSLSSTSPSPISSDSEEKMLSSSASSSAPSPSEEEAHKAEDSTVSKRVVSNPSPAFSGLKLVGRLPHSSRFNLFVQKLSSVCDSFTAENEKSTKTLHQLLSSLFVLLSRQIPLSAVSSSLLSSSLSLPSSSSSSTLIFENLHSPHGPSLRRNGIIPVLASLLKSCAKIIAEHSEAVEAFSDASSDKPIEQPSEQTSLSSASASSSSPSTSSSSLSPPPSPAHPAPLPPGVALVASLGSLCLLLSCISWASFQNKLDSDISVTLVPFPVKEACNAAIESGYIQSLATIFSCCSIKDIEVSASLLNKAPVSSFGDTVSDQMDWTYYALCLSQFASLAITQNITDAANHQKSSQTQRTAYPSPFRKRMYLSVLYARPGEQSETLFTPTSLCSTGAVSVVRELLNSGLNFFSSSINILNESIQKTFGPSLSSIKEIRPPSAAIKELPLLDPADSQIGWLCLSLSVPLLNCLTSDSQNNTTKTALLSLVPHLIVCLFFSSERKFLINPLLALYALTEQNNTFTSSSPTKSGSVFAAKPSLVPTNDAFIAVSNVLLTSPLLKHPEAISDESSADEIAIINICLSLLSSWTKTRNQRRLLHVLNIPSTLMKCLIMFMPLLKPQKQASSFSEESKVQSTKVEESKMELTDEKQSEENDSSSMEDTSKQTVSISVVECNQTLAEFFDISQLIYKTQAAIFEIVKLCLILLCNLVASRIILLDLIVTNSFPSVLVAIAAEFAHQIVKSPSSASHIVQCLIGTLGLLSDCICCPKKNQKGNIAIPIAVSDQPSLKVALTISDIAALDVLRYEPSLMTLSSLALQLQAEMNEKYFQHQQERVTALSHVVHILNRLITFRIQIQTEWQFALSLSQNESNNKIENDEVPSSPLPDDFAETFLYPVVNHKVELKEDENRIESLDDLSYSNFNILMNCVSAGSDSSIETSSSSSPTSLLETKILSDCINTVTVLMRPSFIVSYISLASHSIPFTSLFSMRPLSSAKQKQLISAYISLPSHFFDNSFTSNAFTLSITSPSFQSAVSSYLTSIQSQIFAPDDDTEPNTIDCYPFFSESNISEIVHMLSTAFCAQTSTDSATAEYLNQTPSIPFAKIAQLLISLFKKAVLIVKTEDELTSSSTETNKPLDESTNPISLISPSLPSSSFSDAYENKELFAEQVFSLISHLCSLEPLTAQENVFTTIRSAFTLLTIAQSFSLNEVSSASSSVEDTSSSASASSSSSSNSVRGSCFIDSLLSLIEPPHSSSLAHSALSLLSVLLSKPLITDEIADKPKRKSTRNTAESTLTHSSVLFLPILSTAVLLSPHYHLIVDNIFPTISHKLSASSSNKNYSSNESDGTLDFSLSICSAGIVSSLLHIMAEKLANASPLSASESSSQQELLWTSLSNAVKKIYALLSFQPTKYSETPCDCVPLCSHFDSDSAETLSPTAELLFHLGDPLPSACPAANHLVLLTKMCSSLSDLTSSASSLLSCSFYETPTNSHNSPFQSHSLKASSEPDLSIVSTYLQGFATPATRNPHCLLCILSTLRAVFASDVDVLKAACQQHIVVTIILPLLHFLTFSGEYKSVRACFALLSSAVELNSSAILSSIALFGQESPTEMNSGEHKEVPVSSHSSLPNAADVIVALLNKLHQCADYNKEIKLAKEREKGKAKKHFSSIFISWPYFSAASISSSMLNGGNESAKEIQQCSSSVGMGECILFESGILLCIITLLHEPSLQKQFRAVGLTHICIDSIRSIVSAQQNLLSMLFNVSDSNKVNREELLEEEDSVFASFVSEKHQFEYVNLPHPLALLALEDKTFRKYLPSLESDSQPSSSTSLSLPFPSSSFFTISHVESAVTIMKRLSNLCNFSILTLINTCYHQEALSVAIGLGIARLLRDALIVEKKCAQLLVWLQPEAASQRLLAESPRYKISSSVLQLMEIVLPSHLSFSTQLEATVLNLISRVSCTVQGMEQIAAQGLHVFICAMLRKTLTTLSLNSPSVTDEVMETATASVVHLNTHFCYAFVFMSSHPSEETPVILSAPTTESIRTDYLFFNAMDILIMFAQKKCKDEASHNTEEEHEEKASDIRDVHKDVEYIAAFVSFLIDWISVEQSHGGFSNQSEQIQYPSILSYLLIESASPSQIFMSVLESITQLTTFPIILRRRASQLISTVHQLIRSGFIPPKGTLSPSSISHFIIDPNKKAIMSLK